ncbi:MAG TPA: hypothetical protein VGV67_03405 [Solirubrobacteraceae bacterium]|nr:hypothetical protein [Solirubrobacteraceae bacterium]
MNTNPHASRRVTVTLAGLAATVSTIVVLTVSGTHESHAGSDHAHGAATPQTSKQLALHDGMRSLWEQHVAWTRMAIVSFAGDLPDLKDTTARLLRNQTHIGNAIKPYYGKAAGNELTRLLKEHISGAVDLLVAAKADDKAKLATAQTAWYANGREVSDFLSAANPDNWPRAVVRSMMKKHLDQTLKEAVHQLTGKYAAGIREYDAIERHMIKMADTLSSGIVKQFPARFR